MDDYYHLISYIRNRYYQKIKKPPLKSGSCVRLHLGTIIVDGARSPTIFYEVEICSTMLPSIPSFSFHQKLY